MDLTAVQMAWPALTSNFCGARLACMEHSKIVKEIQGRLFALQDSAYRDFNSKLIPSVMPDKIIGVRTPALRKLAKEYAGHHDIATFLECLPHDYYEENNVHAFIIETVRKFEDCLRLTELFLPFIDNWATCDSFAPPVFKTHTGELSTSIERWIRSSHAYTVRYAIGMLMRFYLDENFSPRYLAAVADVHSDEYYVNMMRAWYFATALAKQYDATVPYIEQKRLGGWTHAKTIQKACESRRITVEQKAQLRLLK